MTDDSNRDFSDAVNQSPGMNEREGLLAAFKPFADFMSGHLFARMPDGVPVTAGSSMARRQLTVGDLRRLAAAIAAPAPSAWQPEPVAYRWRFEGERSWTMTKYRPHDADRPDVICEPLYTSLPSSDRGGVG